MEKRVLEKWQNLLLGLDVDFGAFGISLKYSKCLSSLNEMQLIKDADQEGFSFPHGCLSTLDEEELNLFECKTGLIIPQGYQEYCQVFGSGRFGINGFCIESPSIQYLEKHLGSNRGILEAQIAVLDRDESKGKQLLENSYLLGTGENCLLFVFDLRTYSDRDRSYDIYGVLDDEAGTVLTYFFGRDFFAFIRDICIGQQAKNRFPTWMNIIPSEINQDHPEYADYQSTTFFPFPIQENLPE